MRFKTTLATKGIKCSGRRAFLTRSDAGGCSSLHKHKRDRHLPLRWLCERCGKLFARKGNLFRHIQQLHPTRAASGSPAARFDSRQETTQDVTAGDSLSEGPKEDAAEKYAGSRQDADVEGDSTSTGHLVYMGIYKVWQKDTGEFKLTKF